MDPEPTTAAPVAVADDAPAPPSAQPPAWATPALVAATVALRMPALVADRHLTFDDGVFGASAVAMRHGGIPFRDVFSSQNPLFLPLVWLADQVGLHTLDGTRLLGIASAVGLVLAVLAAGRRIATPSAALLAAGLTSVTGSVLWITGPIAADGPALAFAALSVAIALAYRDEPTVGRALGTGLALGAALSVKSLLIATAVPVGLVLLAARRPRHVVLAVSAAVAVALASALPWGLSNVWDQSVDYHLDAAHDRTPLANVGKVLSTLLDRDMPLVVAAVLAAGAALAAGLRPRHPRQWTLSTPVLLGAWLAATVLVLATEYPLWRPHIAYLVPGIALLVSLRPPPWRLLVVAAVLVLPYHVVRLQPVLWPDAPTVDQRAAKAALADLPRGALAISDEPGLVWRAGRRTPDDLVDGSILRIDSGRITAASLAEAAADPDVCAVVVWSAKRFGSFDDLPDLLVDAGYTVAARYTDPRVLYLKEDCRPS